MNVYDESHALYYEIFNHILNFHAEAAILKEILEEMFDIYVEKMKHISNSTAKSYCKIISKFMLYSPSIDPHDLDKFIQYEFNLKSIEDAKFTKLKGTPLKYHNWINTFLNHIYRSHFSALNPDYSQNIKESSVQTDDYPSLLEVTNAYIELMNVNMFENATIIHLMYSLGVNPETLVLLTFDSIDEEGNMTYFDTQIEKYLTVKLNQNLLRDIMFLKDHRFKVEKETSDSYRLHKDKLIIMGDFIISVSAQAIYNRFSRRFGDMVKWFEYTPSQIVKLSKAMLLIVMKKEEHECLNLIEDTIKFCQES